MAWRINAALSTGPCRGWEFGRFLGRASSHRRSSGGFLCRVSFALMICAAAFCRGANDSPQVYQLLEGSTLLEDCPDCDRPSIYWPMRGRFELEFIDENPLFSRYALRGIAFEAGSSPGNAYVIEGSGSFEFGGEVALQQTMELDLTINGQPVTLTNEVRFVSRPWPMIAIQLVQTKPSSTQVYYLDLQAAPMREIWFSTAHGLTSADPELGSVSSGDLLSSAGRVVRSNRSLLQSYHLMPPIPDVGIDVVEIAPGGEVLFSLNETVFSETIGSIQHGDLLSDRNGRLYLNQQLMEPFGLVFDALDLGLDAWHVRDDGEMLFSITMDMLSPKAGMLHRGDLLSLNGVIARGYEVLYARFQPAERRDFGLDAVYVWPSGEIWFSAEEGFQDAALGAIGPGDLLSDQGYVVVKNLELVGPFQPLEDLADFGLDGVFVVSDFIAPQEPPTLLTPTAINSGLVIPWSGRGRVFQLEQSYAIPGNFQVASPLVPGQEYTVAAPGINPPATVFRLRQW